MNAQVQDKKGLPKTFNAKNRINDEIEKFNPTDIGPIRK